MSLRELRGLSPIFLHHEEHQFPHHWPKGHLREGHEDHEAIKTKIFILIKKNVKYLISFFNYFLTFVPLRGLRGKLFYFHHEEHEVNEQRNIISFYIQPS